MRGALLTAVFLLVLVFGANALPETAVRSHAAAPQLSASALAVPPQSEVRSSDARAYPVIRVIDGDTLTIDMDGVHTTLRLIGLDTPETLDPRKPIQCFGTEASARAKELLADTRVTLEYDSTQGETDKYGRTLAYVFLEDGTLFNRYMIAEGYGHEYTYSIAYKYQDDFKRAEMSARAQKKGLWADDVCSSTPSPTVQAAHGPHECGRNAYNCSDFSSRADAQAVLNACGPSDIHKLDSDGDGEACESLP